jgi:hypothetical protein
MRVKDNEFPVVVQAYDTRDRQDLFVAEQVVSTQAEVDHFTSRYAGKLIKVRLLTEEELDRDQKRPVERKKTSSNTGIWVLVLLTLIALVIAGFTTGWIQRTFGFDVNF